MQVYQSIIVPTKTVLRDVTNPQQGGFHGIEAVGFEHSKVKPAHKRRPLPIYLPAGYPALYDAKDSARHPSSTASSHASTSTTPTNTIRSRRSPIPACPSLKRNAIRTSFDLETTSSHSLATDADPKFKEFLENTRDVMDRKKKAVEAAKRCALWEGVVAPTPPEDGYSVVVPGCSKTFEFGPGMMFAESHGWLVRYIVEWSRGTRYSGERVVLVSKTYPHAITDRESFVTWVEWMVGRDAEERVLWSM